LEGDQDFKFGLLSRITQREHTLPSSCRWQLFSLVQ